MERSGISWCLASLGVVAVKRVRQGDSCPDGDCYLAQCRYDAVVALSANTARGDAIVAAPSIATLAGCRYISECHRMASDTKRGRDSLLRWWCRLLE